MSSKTSLPNSLAVADSNTLRAEIGIDAAQFHACGTPSSFRFVRLAEVCRTSGLSRSQIYRLEAAGHFPKRVKLGLSASAWIESEVLQWCVDRVAASRMAAA